jgi:hypothetical protein
MNPRYLVDLQHSSGNPADAERSQTSLQKKDDFDEKALVSAFNGLSLKPRVKQDPFKEKISGMLTRVFDFLLPAFSLTSNTKQEFQAKDFINFCKATKYLSGYGKAYKLAVLRLPCDTTQFLRYSPALSPVSLTHTAEDELHSLLTKHIQILDLRGFSPKLVQSQEWLRIDEVVKIFSNIQKIHLFPCEFDSAMGQQFSRFPVRMFDLMICSKKNLDGLKAFPQLTHITNNPLLIHDTVDYTTDELSRSILSLPKLENGYNFRDLMNNAIFSEEGIEKLCANCPQIERLELGFPQNLKLDCLQLFGKLTSLKHLVLHDITIGQLIRLIPCLPELRTLSFASGSQKCMKGVLEHIAYHLLYLEKLHFPYDVSGVDISNLGALRCTLNTLEIRVQRGQTKKVIDELAEMYKLKKLKITLDDSDFDNRVQFAKLGNLQDLEVLNIDIWGNSAYEKALVGLKQRLLQCRILLNDEDIQPTARRNESAAHCLSNFSKMEEQRLHSVDYARMLENNNALVSDILCLANGNFEAIPRDLRKILKNIGSTISSIQLSQLTLSQGNLRILCRYFPKLTSLRFERVDFNPKTLKAIYRLYNLKSLEFSNCAGITDESIQKIKSGLGLLHTPSALLGPVGETGTVARTVSDVLHRRINSLSRVPVDMLKPIEQMSAVMPTLLTAHFAVKLRRLALMSRNFRAGMLQFERVNFVPGDLKGVTDVQKLKQLDFRYCSGINDSVVKEIVECCPELESLALIKAEITDRALLHISAKGKMLKKLDLSETLITDSGLIPFALELFATLSEINVSDCPNITMEMLGYLQKVLPKITIVSSFQMPAS